MPVSTVLNLYEGNTDTITLTIVRASDSSPEDLTGDTVEVYFKPNASTEDSDPSVIKLVSPTDITITDAVGGVAQFVVPPEVVDTADQPTFWRCDVVNGVSRRTAMYGAVVIENL